MSEQALKLMEQLAEKTLQGKVLWTAGFEDGQFQSILPDGQLAFVIQVKEDARRFRMLDERQETIIDEQLTKDQIENAPVQEGNPVWNKIGELQNLARQNALQVDAKLVQAQAILSSL